MISHKVLLRVIVGNHREQKFALINFSFKFCETAIYYDNKVFLENLVAVF